MPFLFICAGHNPAECHEPTRVKVTNDSECGQMRNIEDDVGHEMIPSLTVSVPKHEFARMGESVCMPEAKLGHHGVVP